MRLRARTAVVVALVTAVAGAVAVGGTGQAIYGGRSANNDQYPWVVQMRWANGVSCSGSLVRVDAVMTAAHCIEAGSGRFQAVFFPYTHPQAVAGKAKAYPTRATSKYGGFQGVDSCTARDDIALVFLRKAVAIRPVPLTFAAVDVGGSTTVLGFGADSPPGHLQVAKCGGGFPPAPPLRFPNHLKAAGGTVVPTSTCSTIDPPGDQFTFAPETQYCVNNGQSSTNAGDSGGPLVAGGALVGVTSGGVGGPPWLDAFTSVAAEADWIRATLAAHPQAAQTQPLTAAASTRRVVTQGGALRVHAGPALSAPVVGGARAGSTVAVACQAGGWDRLASGGYVADAFLAGSGRLPACSTAAPTLGDEPLLAATRGV